MGALQAAKPAAFPSQAGSDSRQERSPDADAGRTLTPRSAGPAQTEVSEQLRSAIALIRRLIGSNRESLELAKELMLAQEVADLQSARMHLAIDDAAASPGDMDATEEAVAAVAAAEKATAAEVILARSWGMHLGEVYSVVEVAEATIERLQEASSADLD